MYDPSGLYIDPILTGFSVGYENQELYGDRIMPVTPVRTQSGKYRVFDRSSWVIYPSRREPGTVANEVQGGKWSEDNFSTQEHSLQVPVFAEELQQLHSQGGLADPVFGGDLQLDPFQDATEHVTGAIMREHEMKVSTLVRDPGNYGSDNKTQLTSGVQWDDQADDDDSDPVSDVRTAIRAIQTATLRTPNTMVIPKMGANYLETHPKIVARFKNFTLTQADAFYLLTGFQGTVLLVDSVYNAADNIDASEDIQSFWGKDVWLGIVDASPGQRTRTFGKTFAQVYPDGTTRPTERWEEPGRKATLIRTNFKYDLKIVSSGAGYLIQDAFSEGAF